MTAMGELVVLLALVLLGFVWLVLALLGYLAAIKLQAPLLAVVLAVVLAPLMLVFVLRRMVRGEAFERERSGALDLG